MCERRPKLIGIGGGIGSGKSVVSRVLRLKGFEVYDCDSEARRLMDSLPEIKMAIRDTISAEVTDGCSPVDRRMLAGIVFADEDARLKLNAIVHSCVARDLARKAEASDAELFFVEAAILAESGLARLCDSIWAVAVPESDRITRVMRRDGCTQAEAMARIQAQKKEEALMAQHAGHTIKIINTPDTPLLCQINAALAEETRK